MKPVDATELETVLAEAVVEQVVFVADYVEVQFSSGTLTCVMDPVIELNGVAYHFPDAGSRDALSSLIGARATFARVEEAHSIEIDFDRRARLRVPLQSTDWRGEAATFRSDNHALWVFDTAPITRRVKLAQPIIEDDEKRAVIQALESGQLAQGPRVAAFEAAFAKYVGLEHAVAVNSGTAALHVALLAHEVASSISGAGFQPAQTPIEVIVPAFSFAATANVVLQAGALPVFVDVREDDFNMHVDDVQAAVTERTRAVIGVHLYGQPCAIEALAALCERRSIALIEDAAQAVGASCGGRRAGAFGTGCFSLYATKNLQTAEGGMITTNDAAIAERARLFRSQGERTKYVTDELGYNYRMTEVAAALGLAQMPKIDARNERRRKNAARLTELLAPLEDQGKLVLPRTLPGRTHVWHQYTVRVLAGRATRDAVQASMRERGIETVVFYPTPIHRQPLYQRLGYGDLKLPVAERLADEVLSLPVHPALSDDELEQIARGTIASLA